MDSSYEIINTTSKKKIVNDLLKQFKDISYVCCFKLGSSAEANRIRNAVYDIIELLTDYKNNLPKKVLKTKDMNINDLMNCLDFIEKNKRSTIL